MSSAEPSDSSPCNLVVKYLPQGVTEDGLLKMFESFGPIIKCKLIRDRHTGLSRGYGFVKFAQEDHAAKAAESMNGKSLENKTLRVHQSNPSYVKPSRPRGHASSRPTGNLYVAGIPSDWSQEDLQKHFSRFGEIASTKLLVDKVTGDRNGAGFVHFRSHSNAVEAIAELNGTIPQGASAPLQVRFARQRSNSRMFNPNGIRVDMRGPTAAIQSPVLSPMGMGMSMVGGFQGPAHFHAQSYSQQMAYGTVQGGPQSTLYTGGSPTNGYYTYPQSPTSYHTQAYAFSPPDAQVIVPTQPDDAAPAGTDEVESSGSIDESSSASQGNTSPKGSDAVKRQNSSQGSADVALAQAQYSAMHQQGYSQVPSMPSGYYAMSPQYEPIAGSPYMSYGHIQGSGMMHTPLPPSSAPVYRSTGSRQPAADNGLFVFHVPSTATEARLHELFSKYGTVVQVKIVVDPQTGMSKGYGFVNMSSKAECIEAISGMNGYAMDGKYLKVDFKKSKR